RAAVTTARGDDRRNRRILPRIQKGPCADGRGSGDIPGAIKDGTLPHRLEAMVAQRLHAAIEFVPLERTGWRHDGDAVAGPERARLQHPRRTAPSLRRSAGVDRSQSLAAM